MVIPLSWSSTDDASLGVGVSISHIQIIWFGHPTFFSVQTYFAFHLKDRFISYITHLVSVQFLLIFKTTRVLVSLFPPEIGHLFMSLHYLLTISIPCHKTI